MFVLRLEREKKKGERRKRSVNLFITLSDESSSKLLISSKKKGTRRAATGLRSSPATKRGEKREEGGRRWQFRLTL